MKENQHFVLSIRLYSNSGFIANCAIMSNLEAAADNESVSRCVRSISSSSLQTLQILYVINCKRIKANQRPSYFEIQNENDTHSFFEWPAADAEADGAAALDTDAVPVLEEAAAECAVFSWRIDAN